MFLNLELDQWDGSHQDLDHLGEPSFSRGYYVHQSGTENQKREFNSIHHRQLSSISLIKKQLIWKELYSILSKCIMTQVKMTCWI